MAATEAAAKSADRGDRAGTLRGQEVGSETASVVLRKLDAEAGRYHRHAAGITGGRFETELPFPMSFDPAELLDL